MNKQKKTKKKVAKDKKPRKVSYRNWVGPEFVEEISKQVIMKLLL